LGTTIFAKALDALNRLRLKLQVNPKEVIIEQPNSKPYKSLELGGIGNYATQAINRVQWRERLLHNPEQGGAPCARAKYFTSSFGSESSNFMLNIAQSKAADTMLSFMARGKPNTLPTPANRRLWYGDQNTVCSRCGRAGVECEAHPKRLHIRGALTPRHDAVCHEVYAAIKRELGEDTRIFESRTM
jgi:hypothetical protein